MKLIHIHTASDEINANIIKGELENSEIKAFIKPSDEGIPIGGGDPVTGLSENLMPWMIYVPEDKVREAREILKWSNSVSTRNAFPFPFKRSATRLEKVVLIFLIAPWLLMFLAVGLSYLIYYIRNLF